MAEIETEAPHPDDPGGGLRGMLYGGEEWVAGAAVGGARVAVTSHRVLALTPGGDDGRFHEIARPNVEGVAVTASGQVAAAGRALRAGVYAALLLGGGLFVDLGGMIQPVEAPAGAGIGSVLGMVNGLIEALALVDDLLLVAGLLALSVALLFLGRYLKSRERALEIRVAGDDPLRIPVRGDASTARDRVEVALGESPGTGEKT